jgi:hypothetical protein
MDSDKINFSVSSVNGRMKEANTKTTEHLFIQRNFPCKCVCGLSHFIATPNHRFIRGGKKLDQGPQPTQQQVET